MTSGKLGRVQKLNMHILTPRATIYIRSVTNPFFSFMDDTFGVIFDNFSTNSKLQRFSLQILSHFTFRTD